MALVQLEVFSAVRDQNVTGEVVEEKQCFLIFVIMLQLRRFLSSFMMQEP